MTYTLTQLQFPKIITLLLILPALFLTLPTTPENEIERTLKTCIVAGDFKPEACIKNNTGYTVYEDCSYRNQKTGTSGVLSDAACTRIYG